MLFVTLTQAKEHLRIDDDDSDTDVTLKITQAEAIITDYLRVDPALLEGSPPLWTSASPLMWSDRDVSCIQASVLLVLSALYDDELNRTVADYMKAGGVVSLLLARLRRPVFA
jgi:gp6-like head-tail connector protein